MKGNLSLAFISGKGGSGKTTLALSVASLLSDCGVRVLLLDCDLSTHGATYFFEDRLEKQEGKTVALPDLLYSDEILSPQGVMKINDAFSFLPSATEIDENSSPDIDWGQGTAMRFHTHIRQLKAAYDVLLFDCQAGYSDILKPILAETDETLLVMEADAVSSSAARTLFLQIGGAMGRNKSYQIFNKVTQEEYDIYYKVSGGTLFTNLGCIAFDWRVRRAFSVLQVPDMEHTSVAYGAQVFELCKTVFRDEELLERLKQFGLALQIRDAEEKEDALARQLDEAKAGRETALSEAKAKRAERSDFLRELFVVIVSFFTVSTMAITAFEKLKSYDLIKIDDQVLFVLGATMLVTLVVGMQSLFRRIFNFTSEQNALKARKELAREIDQKAVELQAQQHKRAKLEDAYRRLREKNSADPTQDE